MKEIIIKVEGMMCEGCENRIQNSLKSIEGIEKVVANHKEGLVTIVGENVNIDKVKEKIEDIGFGVGNFKPRP